MRKSGYAALVAGVTILAAPAQAVGLADLAKIVLGGSSVLKKADDKCGSSFSLSARDQLALTFARSAAEQALPISEFLSLDQASAADATKAAEAPTFCAETKTKKKGLLSKIGKAAKGLAGKRLGI